MSAKPQPDAAPAAVTSWEQLPLMLRMRDVAALYGISEKTVRRMVERADPSIPRPAFDRPYRWRRQDCQRHYETTSLSQLRRERSKQQRFERAG